VGRVRWFALVGVLAVAGLSACQWDETKFFDLRVVNDTHRAVKVKPCWDQFCLDDNGMPVSLLRPGGSTDESSFWATNDPGTISVVVLSPKGKQIGCLTTSYAYAQARGLVRISRAAPKCPISRGAGPGG
jgi:hypothetical protein